ncbi:hypothetical protein BP6252_01017 [Coleophoma cylindrospora]|uniref:Uncharacterized protein n=1 Tax=Coleophoma cylindrospora TaxID=1849047 RepID=A0A3D8SRP9_9HELO|nr:hypothetical protein BP6252_01017 [Coleophoma cylindrospora]
MAQLFLDPDAEGESGVTIQVSNWYVVDDANGGQDLFDSTDNRVGLHMLPLIAEQLAQFILTQSQGKPVYYGQESVDEEFDD